MSEVVYSNVRFQHPSQPQRRQGLQKPERKFLSDFRCEDCPAPPSWKCIVVVLGISCMVLLLTVGLLTAKCKSSGNQNSFKAGNETDCPLGWHQRGENCYLFSREKVEWIECDRFCSNLESRFLKVETEDELNFVINVSKKYPGLQHKFFIGLYYNRKVRTWVWYDGTNLDLNKLEIPGQSTADNKDIHIKYGQISTEEWLRIGYCICKKKTYSAQMKREKSQKENI